MSLKNFKLFGEGTNTLRRSLALYFIPISIIPVIVISLYATLVVERNNNEILRERAITAKALLMADLEANSQKLVKAASERASQSLFQQMVKNRSKGAIRAELRSFNVSGRARVYSRGGKFITGYGKSKGQDIDYIPQESVKAVRKNGASNARFFLPDGNGIVEKVRVVIRSGRSQIGILEEEHMVGKEYLQTLKKTRQLDLALFDTKFSSAVGSFALPENEFKAISSLAFKKVGPKGSSAPYTTVLGKERYATFLYPVRNEAETEIWGYLGLFMPMTRLDAAVGGLKRTMIYLALLLVVMASLLIFIFSNRLVRPIEALVAAMKRAKGGQVDEIPDLESTIEIEYLVRSFNAMARHIAQGKRTIEAKLEELKGANQEIQQAQSTLVQSAKMASLGQMVAGVAHELNNPIGFIYSNMHHLTEYANKLREMMALYKKHQAKLPESQRKEIEDKLKALEIEYILEDIDDLTKSCLDGAQRTREIVTGLRSFSRIDDESVFKKADLTEGLSSTIKLLRTEFKDRITVHEEYGEIEWVECNRSQVNQVFMNLLANAAHAIKQKGDIWVVARQEADQIVIEIEDNGEGMDKETQDKIFDPFFTTKTVGEGTGLGLSIAYGLIQKHNGTISVDSEAGVGTRFTITLPVRQPTSLASA